MREAFTDLEEIVFNFVIIIILLIICVLVLLSSSLNGTHGEWTCTDDLDHAGRARAQREARNHLHRRPVENRRPPELVPVAGIADRAAPVAGVRRVIDVARPHQDVAPPPHDAPDVVVDVAPAIDNRRLVHLNEVWLPSARALPSTYSTFYVVMCLCITVTIITVMHTALESCLTLYIMELITPLGVYGCFVCWWYFRERPFRGVRAGIPEDGVAVLNQRVDDDAWSYSYAPNAYRARVCIELSDSLVEKFFSSDASVLGTANRMVYHAVESGKTMMLDEGAVLEPTLINESVKHAVHRLRALQLSRGADTGVARRPTVSPFA